jgi:cobalt/nickel transport system permease protein
MHVPDGFLDATTSIATGVIAAIAIAVALKGARRELDDRTAPMAGLVAAFVFAAQMLNFPVGAGTSGHLLGGALAAVLVGPFTAALCLAVVLVVQALLFADGGITALGTNITLFSVVAVGSAWFVFRGLQQVLPKRLPMVPVASGVAALVSVPVTALAFVGLFAIGGQVPAPLGAVATAMLGWHTLIGIGEGLITALVVASVVDVRPDLVYGARPLLTARPLEVRTGGVAS